MTKTLYIIRGLPGSGKSTLGSKLAGKDSYAADDYFMKWEEGKYVYTFDPSKLSEAHKRCHLAVERAMFDKAYAIAVCNTFTRQWEMEPYRQLARKYGYMVQTLTVESGLTDAELAERNTHSVPVEAIAKMRARWEL